MFPRPTSSSDRLTLKWQRSHIVHTRVPWLHRAEALVPSLSKLAFALFSTGCSPLSRSCSWPIPCNITHCLPGPQWTYRSALWGTVKLGERGCSQPGAAGAQGPGCGRRAPEDLGQNGSHRGISMEDSDSPLMIPGALGHSLFLSCS